MVVSIRPVKRNYPERDGGCESICTSNALHKKKELVVLG